MVNDQLTFFVLNKGFDMKKYIKKLMVTTFKCCCLNFFLYGVGFACPSVAAKNCTNSIDANCGGIYQTSGGTCDNYDDDGRHNHKRCTQHTFILCQDGKEYGEVNGTMLYYCEASTTDATCTS